MESNFKFDVEVTMTMPGSLRNLFGKDREKESLAVQEVTVGEINRVLAQAPAFKDWKPKVRPGQSKM